MGVVFMQMKSFAAPVGESRYRGQGAQKDLL